ncbi:MAG: hypothetical protein RBU37_01220 [Myxococcota bacterium]|jgi:hypothetical protein|nr:hypothetical protein [Myxococcota bacterium]
MLRWTLLVLVAILPGCLSASLRTVLVDAQRTTIGSERVERCDAPELWRLGWTFTLRQRCHSQEMEVVAVRETWRNEWTTERYGITPGGWALLGLLQLVGTGALMLPCLGFGECSLSYTDYEGKTQTGGGTALILSSLTAAASVISLGSAIDGAIRAIDTESEHRYREHKPIGHPLPAPSRPLAHELLTAHRSDGRVLVLGSTDERGRLELPPESIRWLSESSLVTIVAGCGASLELNSRPAAIERKPPQLPFRLGAPQRVAPPSGGS